MPPPKKPKNQKKTRLNYICIIVSFQVNANITSDSGGTCYCPRTSNDYACDSDNSYKVCVEIIKRDLVTATAAIASLTTVRNFYYYILQDSQNGVKF
jgi:hypothetical protein